MSRGDQIPKNGKGSKPKQARVYLPHPPLPPPPASSTPSVIEIASRTPRPSFRPTILSAPLRPRLPPSILMLRILASHGYRQRPAPANIYSSLSKQERTRGAPGANNWQGLNADEDCDRRLSAITAQALIHVGKMATAQSQKGMQVLKADEDCDRSLQP